MPITQAQLAHIMPTNKAIAQCVAPLNEAFARYQINTRQRMACFLAQVGHESLDLTAMRENLNYSAAGLQRTWPNRFNATTAAQYARQPEKIANKVYANRLGNGSEASGDGWKYRGRGWIQLTGKANYQAFAQEMGISLDEAVTLLETPRGAAFSAGWFWHRGNLNALADANRFTAITQRINGGQNGAADRVNRYTRALSVLV